jgi:hypothetical protein
MKIQVRVHVVDLDDGWVFLYVEMPSGHIWPVAILPQHQEVA